MGGHCEFTLIPITSIHNWPTSLPSNSLINYISVTPVDSWGLSVTRNRVNCPSFLICSLTRNVWQLPHNYGFYKGHILNLNKIGSWIVDFFHKDTSFQKSLFSTRGRPNNNTHNFLYNTRCMWEGISPRIAIRSTFHPMNICPKMFYRVFNQETLHFWK